MSRSSERSGRYTVRRWGGLVALVMQVTTVLVVGLVLGVAQDRMAINLVTVAVAVALGVAAFDRATLAVRLDASGVTWGQATPRVLVSTAGLRRVDWAAIEGLEVVESRLLRARLSPGGPLPAWMRGRTTDPDAPALMVQGPAPGIQAAEVLNLAIIHAQHVSVRPTRT